MERIVNEASCPGTEECAGWLVGLAVGRQSRCGRSFVPSCDYSFFTQEKCLWRGSGSLDQDLTINFALRTLTGSSGPSARRALHCAAAEFDVKIRVDSRCLYVWLVTLCRGDNCNSPTKSCQFLQISYSGMTLAVAEVGNTY